MKRTPIKRKTRIRQRNRKRQAQKYQVAYGDHGDCVRASGCAVAGPDCLGVIEAAHYPSRARGGMRWDMIGLCKIHHDEQEGEPEHERPGHPQRFQRKYRIDLKEVAAKLWMECGCPKDDDD